jgi:hypothetical protein
MSKVFNGVHPALRHKGLQRGEGLAQDRAENVRGELFALIVPEHANLYLLLMAEVEMVVHLAREEGVRLHGHSLVQEEIARTAMQTTQCPESLMPRTAEVVLDRHYILSAAGLLTKKYPEAAKAILGKELT